MDEPNVEALKIDIIDSIVGKKDSSSSSSVSNKEPLLFVENPSPIQNDIQINNNNSSTNSSSKSKATSSSITTDGPQRGNLLIIAPVSKREINPYLALAFNLKQRGWNIAIAATDSLEPLITNTNLFQHFYALQWPLDDLIETLAFKQAYLEGSLLDQSSVLGSLEKYLETNWRKEWDAACDFRADALVCAINALPDSLSIGQRLNVPCYLATTRPCATSSQLPPLGINPTPVAPLNKLLHWGARTISALGNGERVTRFRARLGLFDPLSWDIKHLPQLLMLSPLVVKRPSDYGANIEMCGFATLPPPLYAAYEAPDELRDFLAHDNAPYYVAFDMPAPDGLAERVVAALESVNKRGLLYGSYTKDLRSVGPVPDHVLVLDDEPPLEWLLPQCAAAVLCGEMQRFAAALVSGCPVTVFPVTPLQRFVADRHAAARGAKPNPRLVDLTAADLVAALVDIDDDETRRKAKALAARLVEESGAASAAVWLERRYQTERCAGVKMRDGGWQPDSALPHCTTCQTEWSLLTRRHHCRSCGRLFCGDCLALDRVPNFNDETMVCKQCFEARAHLRERGSLLPEF